MFFNQVAKPESPFDNPLVAVQKLDIGLDLVIGHVNVITARNLRFSPSESSSPESGAVAFEGAGKGVL